MASKHRLTDLAQADLDDIFDHTVETWGEQQAVRYTDGLAVALDECCTSPVLRRTLTIPNYEPFRFVRYQSHYVFFREGGEMELEVYAILHERMDLIARLKARLDDE